jgi:hypothetical protein
MAATSAAQSAAKGFAYTVGNRLFFALTNATNRGTTLFAAQGPNFSLPSSYAPFSPLPDGVEPSAQQLAAIVEDAYDGDRWKTSVGSSMGEEDEGVWFAGQGEPLIRLPTLLETVEIVKENRHGIPFGIETNGLFAPDVAQQLVEAGVKRMSVQMITANPKQYAELAKPHEGTGGHAAVCSFVATAAEAGAAVTVTAVKIPGVDVRAAKALASALGAVDFEAQEYCG